MADRLTGFFRRERRLAAVCRSRRRRAVDGHSGMAGGAWAYYKFRVERDDARKLEAQRPFLQKKLEVYFDAVRAAGRLTDQALAPTSPEWKVNVQRFLALRWSELEMVGDAGHPRGRAAGR
ncbi:hypothetical protein CI1B_32040 [Bradyrhizobium ivorense]|uniref:Uncharacterized protein n=1 Tax=Bradyrhizobium ivorense TaxID=2511166 RepID=A0A508T8F1_9BRAD|nr:hypothetical protein [Bradyrhizobium ivorense]VIO70550.1 hypothetical protein CI1B_32040 [Bradyrhizobium ivorense]